MWYQTSTTMRLSLCALPWALWIYSVTAFAKETVEDAARIARALVDHSKTSIGTMATIFPSDDPKLAGQPFSLQEYYASCHKNGSLTLLFLPISRQNQNILRSPTHAASISITAEIPSADRPRVSLIGNVTVFNQGSSIPNVEFIRRCYVEKHPDAAWWLPDDRDGAHVAYWAQFDPHSIYFVGGFGGMHYIGDIPLPVYREAYRNDSGSRVLVEQYSL